MSPNTEINPNKFQKELLNIVKRVAGNSLWLFIGHLGSRGFMVVFTILIARRLGQEGLGQYAFMASVIFLFNVFTTFGADIYIIREIAAKKDFSLLGPSLIMQLSFSAALVLVTFLAAPTIPNQANEAVQALQIYSFILFPMAFYTIFSTALRGSERMNTLTLINLIMGLSQTILLWFIIQPNTSIVSLAWLLLGTQTFVAALAGFICLRILPGIRKNWNISWVGIINLSRVSAILFSLSLLKVIYQRITIYMLYITEGSGNTGLFSAALRVVDTSELGHIALLGALFPVMAQTHSLKRPNSPARKRIFSYSGRLLLILGALITAFLYSFANPIITVLYGSEFVPAIGALQILSLTVIPYSVNIYISTRLLSGKHEHEVAYAIIVSLIVLISLNMLWIPRFGILGACLAILFAEVTQAGMYLFFRSTYSDDAWEIVGKANPV